jgi:hypothetical protein
VAIRILTSPGNLTNEDRAALTAITAHCPELATTRILVGQFTDMLTYRHGSKGPH